MDIVHSAQIQALTAGITAMQDQIQVLTDLAATQATTLADLRARVKALEAQAHPPFIAPANHDAPVASPYMLSKPPHP